MQSEIEARLKQELTPTIFQLFLEMEDVLNYRNAIEKEQMYLFGIKDGLQMWKQLQEFISE